MSVRRRGVPWNSPLVFGVSISRQSSDVDALTYPSDVDRLGKAACVGGHLGPVDAQQGCAAVALIGGARMTTREAQSRKVTGADRSVRATFASARFGLDTGASRPDKRFRLALVDSRGRVAGRIASHGAGGCVR